MVEARPQHLWEIVTASSELTQREEEKVVYPVGATVSLGAGCGDLLIPKSS